jgi:hypothetical protein
MLVLKLNKGKNMHEKKAVLLWDKKTNRLRRFSSDWKSHYYIVRDNGFNDNDVIETLIFIDKKPFIFECYNEAHKAKIRGTQKDYFFDYESRFLNHFKARISESIALYGRIKEGD